jgi:signal transduction histidine kinase
MSEFLTSGNAPVLSAAESAGYRVRTRGILRQLNVGFFQTASFRLAVIYAIVFGISSVILSASLWHSTSGLLDRRTQAEIRVYAKSFSNRYNSGGILAVTKTINSMLIGETADHALFLLVDAQGNRIAGNLDNWPPTVALPRKWYLLPVRTGNSQTTVFYRFYLLPGGFKLLVGHDTSAETGILNILQSGMVSALLEMVVLCLVGASVIRVLAKRAISDLSAVVDAISEGDLTKRVGQRTSGYEFDRIARAVNEILDRMAALMEGVRNVSNSIAHDLRTPITRVRVRLEDAILYAAGEDELRQAIELATCDLDNLTSLFQALLRIGEIESGTRRSAFCDFDLEPILLDLMEMYGAVADEREITLVNDIDCKMTLVGDNQMIQQAIANLLGNSIKFSPSGTSVRLSVQIEQDNLQISVQDEGLGIPEKDLARASERFYRAEVARSTPGTGLGLALVAAVCSLHRGTLRLENTRPGLLATITLPRIH